MCMHVKKLHSRLIEDGTYDKNILEYYIVERRIGEQYCELKSYGIQIRYIYGENGGEENKYIGDIFFSESDTENFVKILAKNKVKPADFKTVIDEYVKETIAMRKKGKTA